MVRVPLLSKQGKRQTDQLSLAVIQARDAGGLD